MLFRILQKAAVLAGTAHVLMNVAPFAVVPFHWRNYRVARRALLNAQKIVRSGNFRCNKSAQRCVRHLAREIIAAGQKEHQNEPEKAGNRG